MKELEFRHLHKLIQVEGAVFTGFAAYYGESMTNNGGFMPGLMAVGIIGSINAAMEIYKYRQFERRK